LLAHRRRHLSERPASSLIARPSERPYGRAEIQGSCGNPHRIIGLACATHAIVRHLAGLVAFVGSTLWSVDRYAYRMAAPVSLCCCNRTGLTHVCRRFSRRLGWQQSTRDNRTHE
jgi:hypothetical protein